MATAVDDRKTAIMTLELGAYGYVIKPFDRNEILINVANALERRRLTLLSQEHGRALEAKVQLNEKYRKLVQFFPYGIAEFALARSISSGMTDEELLALILEARVTDGNIEFAMSYGSTRWMMFKERSFVRFSPLMEEPKNGVEPGFGITFRVVP